MAVTTLSLVDMTSKRGNLLSSDSAMSSSSKSFNINLSRLATQEEQNSMLAYSEKLRNFREARERRQYGNLNDSLQVNAKRIPKFSHSGPKVSQRKPLSLDELTGRKARSLDGDDVNRSVCTSPCWSLPGKTSKSQDNTNDASGVSFMSSTDYNDIVGYKVKKDKRQTYQELQQTGQFGSGNVTKTKVAEYLRSNVLPPIKTNNKGDGLRKQLNIGVPRYAHMNYVLRRPKRAKRMQLKGSHLNDIPEYIGSASPSAVTDSDSNNQTVSSSKLHSRNSMLNQDTTRIMSSLEMHIPTSSLRDKLGLDSVNHDPILTHSIYNTHASPRHTIDERNDRAKRLENEDIKASKPKHVKVKRLIFLNENDKYDN